MGSTGEKIMRARLKAELSATAVARDAGITRQGLWKIELGKSEPKTETGVRIARAIGVPPAELLL